MKCEVSLRRTIGVLALVFTSWTILATSQVHMSLVAGTVRVQSDCAGTRDVTDVTVLSYQVSAPTGVTFQNFGFPSDIVRGEPVTGTVGAAQRTCKRTVGDDLSSDDWVYSCFDDGAFVCNIYMLSIH
jgi:hypothetical protein